MRRLLCTAVAGLAVLVMAGAAGADQTYTDASGDSGAGTDLRSAAVSNDPAGNITMAVTVGNPLLPNHVIVVFIDSDNNPSTGAPGIGSEYELFAFPTIGGQILAWNGSTFAPANAPSFHLAAGGNVQTFAVNRADLGNTSVFAFAIVSASVDNGSLNVWDVMPESNFFVYTLVFPQCSNGKDDDGDGKVDAQDLGCSGATDDNESDDPVHVALGTARVLPLHPKAGGKAVVSAPALRTETGKAPESGSVKCAARIVGGVALRGAGAFVGGRAQCTFTIPATAKGKAVRGTMVLTFQTATATKPFSFTTARV